MNDYDNLKSRPIYNLDYFLIDCEFPERPIDLVIDYRLLHFH